MFFAQQGVINESVRIGCRLLWLWIGSHSELVIFYRVSHLFSLIIRNTDKMFSLSCNKLIDDYLYIGPSKNNFGKLFFI